MFDLTKKLHATPVTIHKFAQYSENKRESRVSFHVPIFISVHRYGQSFSTVFLVWSHFGQGNLNALVVWANEVVVSWCILLVTVPDGIRNLEWPCVVVLCLLDFLDVKFEAAIFEWKEGAWVV